MSTTEVFPFEVSDPHFHFWTLDNPNPNLGDILESLPHYKAADYAADAVGAGVRITSAVHVETIVGQYEGGHRLDEVAETRWVITQAEELAKAAKMVVVPYLKIDRFDVAEVLAEHRRIAGDRFVGVRMILNYHDTDPTICWPQVGRGDFLTGGVASFATGFALLAEQNLSFDLQCNPHQLTHAANFLLSFPGVKVALNHCGCPRLGRGAEEDKVELAVWRQGMKELAANPMVSVKVSMMTFVRKGWTTEKEAKAQARELVLEIIELFSARRVMFASNFPVDKFTGTPLREVFDTFHEFVAHLPHAERVAMFHDNAHSFYKF